MNKTLTKEWSAFNGDYEKAIQDIKLFNGDIVEVCWPNAGFWIVFKSGKHYGRDIPVKEAEYVRLSHRNTEG
jgi:hypothetical protein